MNAIYGSSGINWHWFVAGDFNEVDKTVTVHFHERWHYGDAWPALLFEVLRNPASFEFLEDKDRNAYGLRIRHAVCTDGVVHHGEVTDYLILNPGYVFSYKNFDMLKGTKEV